MMRQRALKKYCSGFQKQQQLWRITALPFCCFFKKLTKLSKLIEKQMLYLIKSFICLVSLQLCYVVWSKNCKITLKVICDQIKITCSKSDLRSDQDHDLEYCKKVICYKITWSKSDLRSDQDHFLPQRIKKNENLYERIWVFVFIF